VESLPLLLPSLSLLRWDLLQEQVQKLDYTTSRGIAEICKICKICKEKSIEIKVTGANNKVNKFLINSGVVSSIIE
jgi:ABC-type transporter Mla MlaB component